MRRVLLLGVSLIVVLNCKVFAQSLLLKRLAEKIASFKTISYLVITKNESPTGDDADTISIYEKPGSTIKSLQFASFARSYKEAYKDRTLLSIDLRNKFYSVHDGLDYASINSNTIPFFKLIDIIQRAPMSSVKQLADTVVGNVDCYHLKITQNDTLLHGKRVYTIYQLYLKKIDLLPVYTENLIQGFMEKGGVSSQEVFKLVNQSAYSNYRLNQNDFPDQTRIGEKAPFWKLENLNGELKSSNDLIGKVVLIDFFGNYCAPCIFSIPVINRLHEKYKNSPVAIVSVDLDQGKEAAIKFSSKYNLSDKAYINGRIVGDKFHVGPIPTFYLIDKHGRVAMTVDGYSEDREARLIRKIDLLK